METYTNSFDILLLSCVRITCASRMVSPIWCRLRFSGIANVAGLFATGPSDSLTKLSTNVQVTPSMTMRHFLHRFNGQALDF